MVLHLWLTDSRGVVQWTWTSSEWPSDPLKSIRPTAYCSPKLLADDFQLYTWHNNSNIFINDDENQKYSYGISLITKTSKHRLAAAKPAACPYRPTPLQRRKRKKKGWDERKGRGWEGKQCVLIKSVPVIAKYN